MNPRTTRSATGSTLWRVMQMHVTLQCFDGCPHWKTTRDRLIEVLGDETLAFQRVETQEEAERIGFIGSPTILLNGVDPFAAADAPFGLACRIYVHADGSVGAPTLDDIRSAVAQARS